MLTYTEPHGDESERLQRYLKLLLICSGLSETDLAKRAFVSRSYISQIITGKLKAGDDITKAIIATFRDMVRRDQKGYALLGFILEQLVLQHHTNYSEKAIEKVLNMFSLSWMRDRDQRIESWDIFHKLYEHYMEDSQLKHDS